jgi:CRISPR/Cas system endoribonuclease Cas6 (RAMP superfamily)
LGKEINIRELLDKAKQIKKVQSNLFMHEWKRYSNRQGKTALRVFSKEITFEGDFSDFIPLLLIGQYIHVGKNSVFGLGKYEIL